MSRQDDAPATSVDKALTVLEALVAARPEGSLSDIALASGFPKPNTHRMLQMLVRRGYATSDGRGSYQPGPQILSLAGQVLLSLDYANLARPHLLALHDQVADTVHFALLQDERLYYVEKIDGKRPYQMRSIVGQELNLHSSSIGKAVLAALPTEERSVILNGRVLSKDTKSTKIDPAEVAHELEHIKRVGYAIDDEENNEGVRCVGAAVYGALGRVIGAVSVSGPAFYIEDDDFQLLAPLVIDAASDISVALGAPRAVVEWGKEQARLLRVATKQRTSDASGPVGSPR